MKPKDLKPPFSWESRYVLLEDKVFYIPERYDCSSFAFPGGETIFGNQNPVYIEYCSGNGDWIIDQAQANPDANWVAIEKRFDRVRKIWSKRENLGIKNLLVTCSMAQTVTKEFIPEGSISKIFVNFPDPWPKDRHAKHRLFQPPFIEELYSILKDKGELIGVTDDPDYIQQILEVVIGHGGLESKFEKPYTKEAWPIEGRDENKSGESGYGKTSYFEALWSRLGRRFYFYRFEKQKELASL